MRMYIQKNELEKRRVKFWLKANEKSFGFVFTARLRSYGKGLQFSFKSYKFDIKFRVESKISVFRFMVRFKLWVKVEV